MSICWLVARDTEPNLELVKLVPMLDACPGPYLSARV